MKLIYTKDYEYYLVINTVYKRNDFNSEKSKELNNLCEALDNYLKLNKINFY